MVSAITDFVLRGGSRELGSEFGDEKIYNIKEKKNMNDLTSDLIKNSELFITFIALIITSIISIVSIVIGVITLCIQRTHNMKSIKPIGIITLSDFENLIKIKIKNSGIGPMIITSCKTKNRSAEKECPIDWLPSNIVYKNFRKGLENHVLAPNEESVLLEIEFDKSQNTDIDKIRNILKDLTLTIEYKDIYDKNKNKVEKKFDWFGRNL